MVSGPDLALLVAWSLLPALFFLVWLRQLEQKDREPWSRIAAAFVFGGTGGVLIAVLLHMVFDITLADPTSQQLGLSRAFVGLVVAAPLVEELAKGLGLGVARRNIRSYQDGIVYGAAIGLGFGAAENLVYGIAAFQDDGAVVAITTIFVRTFSSLLLHAGASAFLGFGYAVLILHERVLPRLLPSYLVAVLLHATYNFVAHVGNFLGLAASLAIGIGLWRWLRRRIEELEALPHEPRTWERVERA